MENTKARDRFYMALLRSKSNGDLYEILDYLASKVRLGESPFQAAEFNSHRAAAIDGQKLLYADFTGQIEQAIKWAKDENVTIDDVSRGEPKKKASTKKKTAKKKVASKPPTDE